MTARTNRSPIGLASNGQNRPAFVLRPSVIAYQLTALSLFFLFLVSPFMLGGLGIPYATAGGNPLSKFHPASFTAILAVVFHILAEGGPIRFFSRVWRETPGMLIFLGGIIILIYQAVIVQKMPASSIVDTFVLAFCLFLAIVRLSPPAKAFFAGFVHVAFFANSALSYIEHFSRFRLTPFMINGEAVDFDWRATALFGHPLTNACETGIYIVLLATGAGRFGGLARGGLILFHLGALNNFGGRASTVLCFLMLALILAVEIGRTFAGRRFSVNQAIAIVLGITGFIAGFFILLEAGAFQQFIERFVDDNGSASARVQMMSIFRDLTLPEILFAPDQTTVANTQRNLGLTVAIESFEIAFVAYYGLIVSLAFFASLGFFLAEILRRVGIQAVLPLFFFLFVSSSTTGIANKTIELSMLMSVLLLVLPWRDGETARVPER